MRLNVGNLPLDIVESVVKKHQYGFEGFGLMTNMGWNKFGGVGYERHYNSIQKRNHIDRIEVSDLARRQKDKVGVIGFSPFIDQAFEDRFLDITMGPESSSSDWLNKLTGKHTNTFSQDLYSPRGVQSVAVSELKRKKLSLDSNDIDSKLLLESISNKWGTKYFELRPLYALRMLLFLEVKETEFGSNHDFFLSIPTYCKLTGMSMSEVDWDKYILNVKQEYNNNNFLNHFSDDLRQTLKNY